MPAPTLIRNHKLDEIRPAEGKMLIKLHGVQTVLTQVNENELEPEGEVLAVGPGYRLPDGTCLPAPVKVGDFVILGRVPVTPIKVDGVVCYLTIFQAIEAIVGKGEVEKLVKP